MNIAAILGSIFLSFFSIVGSAVDPAIEVQNDRMCLFALRDYDFPVAAMTKFALNNKNNNSKQMISRIPPDILAEGHPGFAFPSSNTVRIDAVKSASFPDNADFFLHRTKRRALDLKTKDMKANERPVCRKTSGQAYGQEERTPSAPTVLGPGAVVTGLLKSAPKISDTKVRVLK